MEDGNYKLKWSSLESVKLSDTEEIQFFGPENGSYTDDLLPLVTNQIALSANTTAEVRLSNVHTAPLTAAEAHSLSAKAVADATETFTSEIKDNRGRNYAVVSFVPLIRRGNSFEKIISYSLQVTKTGQAASRKAKNNTVSNSVLATGEWYRIGVTKTGIYKIDRQLLQKLGVDVENVNPRAINIYGNGFGQLPFKNWLYRPDDLLLNAVVVSGENDESFDEGDYILFYGKSASTWTYNDDNNLFQHNKHDYTDTSYYFIGINTGDAPKRVQVQNGGGFAVNYVVETFNDYKFHELDHTNLMETGRRWFGEKFDAQTTYNFSGADFTFPNLDPAAETTVIASVAARTINTQSTFTLSVNGVSTSSILNAVGSSSTSTYATDKELKVALLNASPTLNINLSFQKGNAAAMGWLDYLEINTRRFLRRSGEQFSFRDMQSVGTGRMSQFRIGNGTGVDAIWDVTDPSNAHTVAFSREGDKVVFTASTEILREFIAFTGQEYYSPVPVGSVPNQNLHALGTNGVVDMVVVCPQGLFTKAEEFAELHRNFESAPLNVAVVTLQQVYNEFSSGMRDITAIKMLMKMLYDRAGANTSLMPRYLLLFGDGSYDNRNFTGSASNLVPTYQSYESFSQTTSYVSDDYFGLLSDEDGESPVDLMDIAVGRFVVKNIQEAGSAVRKVKNYMYPEPVEANQNCSTCNNSSSVLGDWRNIIALVADDEDNKMHMSQARELSDMIDDNTQNYNIERLFIDAYQQVATPGGERYPDVNAAIDRRVQEGAFIINYTGHGGQAGWAHERILDIPTIQSWSNFNQLPIFITATCEFTRFDDPLRTSAGEYVFLNSNGGGIALLSTTRLVYSSPNFALNKAFYRAFFEHYQVDQVVRLGDLARESKNESANNTSSNHRNFTLFGDPALPLAIPKFTVQMTALTDTTGAPVDTLKALGVARVEGIVVSEGTAVLEDFNGLLNVTVFDRKQQKQTLGNDGISPFNYTAQENVIYRGNAAVENGHFQFDFVIPKDIDYSVDTTARFSFYAASGTTDATGFVEELTIGSRDENAVDDGTGPELQLYLNDKNFVFGGYTNETPILLAIISDDNGINTVGNGIGHDITAVIDGNTSEVVNLNDQYEADLNTYKSGSIRFQMDKLQPGEHNIKVKVWDVFNNSTETYTEFIVASSEKFAIERLLNYPNPFTTHTDFYFEHNQSCQFLNVLIEVFTVSGKLVKSINTTAPAGGFRIGPISWDGKDTYGDKLATGVYIYKVSVRNPSGEKVEKFEKMVILN